MKVKIHHLEQRAYCAGVDYFRRTHSRNGEIPTAFIAFSWLFWEGVEDEYRRTRFN